MVHGAITMRVGDLADASLKRILVFPRVVPEARQASPFRSKRRCKPLGASRSVFKVCKQVVPSFGRGILQTMSVAPFLFGHPSNIMSTCTSTTTDHRPAY